MTVISSRRLYSPRVDGGRIILTPRIELLFCASLRNKPSCTCGACHLIRHHRKALQSVLQPEQDRAEHSRIRSRTEMPKIAQISGISQQDRTQEENTNLTYKEGVAGSNPASSTTLCSNRAATQAERSRTEQEKGGAESANKGVNKRDSPTEQKGSGKQPCDWKSRRR